MPITKQQLEGSVERSYQDDSKINIAGIAEELGIKVYYEKRLASYFGNFNAEIIKKGDTYSIYVNPYHSITRQRFSIAHELAHLVKHRQILDADGSMSRQGSSKQENEADDYAARLLMPKKFVKRFIRENEDIQEDNAIDSDIVRMVARHFNVSPVVSIIRLRKLKYAVPFIDLS